MGWANCGEDSKGRSIGYAHQATCDHTGCEKRIDRGLSYACGGMHGEDNSCEGYFCPEHLGSYWRSDEEEEMSEQLCERCGEIWEKSIPTKEH